MLRVPRLILVPIDRRREQRVKDTDHQALHVVVRSAGHVPETICAANRLEIVQTALEACCGWSA